MREGNDPSRITTTSRVRPLGDRRSRFAVAGSCSVLLRARCSHEASPCPRLSCLHPAVATFVFRVTLRWGPRDPNIQLLPYVVTHGHTRRSSRSSSARSCRFCPRCRPAFGLAPWCRAILGRHDRPREEPCLLQGRLRPISRSSLSRSSFREWQALLGAGAALASSVGSPGAHRD